MLKVLLFVVPFILSINSTYLQYAASERNISPCEESFSVTSQYIVDDKARNDVIIEYPQISGLKGIKDIFVNKLIKNEIYQLVERSESSMNKHYALILYLNYEIKYLSNDFISIVYKGSWGARFNAGRGYANRLYSINIDVNQNKILNVSDVIKNGDAVYDILAQDKFESINTIEGIKGNYKFSSKHDHIQQGEIKKELNSKNKSADPYLDWYISDNNLVFAIGEPWSYYEYSISINEIKEFLYPDFYEKMNSD